MFTVQEVKAALVEAIFNKVALAGEAGLIDNIPVRYFAEMAAELNIIHEELIPGWFIINLKDRYGAFLLTLLDEPMSYSVNWGQIEAAADVAVFAITGRAALDAYDFNASESQQHMDLMVDALTSLYNDYEARLSSQANEEALANGENITGDDEINYLPHTPIDGDAENTHDAATSVIRVNGEVQD